MKKMLLAACALLAMAGTARGDEISDYASVGHWDIVKGDSHCTSLGGYENGTLLAFSVNLGGDTWISVAHPKWKIPAGEYKVPARVDSVELSDMTFVVEQDGSTRMTYNFQMTETSYNFLTKGNVLSLNIGNTVYQYKLKDTSKMIPKLLECIGSVAASANPFHGQKPVAPVSTPENPFKRT